MPARLSLAGQCPPVAACVALRLRAVAAPLQLADLPAELRGEGRTPASACESGGGPERDALLDALVRHRWKPMAAARELGISRATLYRRVRRHGIRMPGQADD